MGESIQRQWVTLEDYIEGLLLDGKRSGHEDFQKLFAVFGQAKITEIAKRKLIELKKKESEGGNVQT